MANNSFEIVIGDHTNIEEISRIFKEVFEQTYPSLVGHHSPDKIRAMITNGIDEGTQVRLAKVDGVTAGFMMFKPDFLDQLYILKSFQGRGIGRAFMEHMFKFGSETISLYTLASNLKAIEFYKSFGFKIVREGVSPDEKVPDVKMLWK